MFNMAVTMVTQLNEMRPLAGADCYKGRLYITFTINPGKATIKVLQKHVRKCCIDTVQYEKTWLWWDIGEDIEGSRGCSA